MITKRIVANLIAFAVVSIALVVYGFVDLLGNPLRQATTVSTVLPTASGLSKNFVVALNGVPVGSVANVALVPHGAKVTMTLDPGTSVPADVEARVVVANALGEQQVELVPAPTPEGPHGSSLAARRTLRNGAVIPAAPDPTPASIGKLVQEATSLLQAIPPGDLNTLLHQAALAVAGRASDLQAIDQASALFSQEFLAYQHQFQQLLANAPPLLDTFTANSSQLRQDLANTAVLAQVLASHRSDLAALLQHGAQASQLLHALVAQSRPNLACLVHDLSDISSNVGSSPNLSNLNTALATNATFFNVVAAVAPEGPAKALNTNDTNRTNQEWLRTRLLLPPAQPSAVQYTRPKTLPAVRPGAGCITEFGAGVGPALQAGFTPTGPGGRVVPPTAAEAHVTGGGTEPAPSTAGSAPAAARLKPEAAPTGPLAAVAVAVMMAVALLGRRRTSRSARALRVPVHSDERRVR